MIRFQADPLWARGPSDRALGGNVNKHLWSAVFGEGNTRWESLMLALKNDPASHLFPVKMTMVNRTPGEGGLVELFC